MKAKSNVILSTIVMFSLLVSLVITPAIASSREVKATVQQENAVANQTPTGVKFDVSPRVTPKLSRPVRDLPLDSGKPAAQSEINRPRGVPETQGTDTKIKDPLAAHSLNDGQTPDPLFTFEAIGDLNFYTPPDTNGDVGPNHYVQIVNAKFAIYDKSGTLLYGPVDNNTLWDGFGGPCETENDGDPIVLYDDMADRWFITQFAPFVSPPLQCVAISTTPDPLGAYYLYAFSMPDFPDYPKFGVWPDGYYFGTNTGFPNAYYVHALDRVSMLAGLPAARISFGGFANLLLPADADGLIPPPAGYPEYFYTYYDEGYPDHPAGVDRLAIYEFDVDWVTPANSTFTLVTEIPVAPFNYTVCGFFGPDCIPEPSPGVGLNSLSWWPMVRLQYRNLGEYEAMVSNFTVDLDGTNKAAIRWFELRKSGADPWALQQEGTYAPDASHRWMGSIAMDGSGNIALGYSVSDATVTKPSIRYAVHEYTDPPGTMQAEAVIMNGNGVNTGPYGRWGDYSAMSVDPSDQCTFWYTNEYHDVDLDSFNWNTRVGVFKVPDCSGGLGPDFSMEAAPVAQPVCAPNTADYQITLESRQGFTDTVDLSTIFTPASVMTSTFSVDPVVPPGSTVLTVGNTGNAAEGHYDIEVTGTAPTKTHSITVGLDVYAGLALAPLLLSPADGASGQAVQPVFSWTGAGMPSTYAIQVALDEGFTQVVEAASGLTETTYTPAVSLATSERYYWRVRTDNVCGEGEYSAPNVFTTVVLASDCGVDYDPVVAYTQGFESGLGGWTHSGTNDTWDLSGVRTHSGAWSVNADDPTGEVSDQMLVSPEFEVAGVLISPTLQFWNYQSIEDRAGGCYDGGLLEITTDGGASWTQVESGLVTDPYDGPIASGHGNPLAGQAAWCGDPQNWLNSVVDLSAYAGQSVAFRYHLGSDNRGAVNRQGWYIDDVVVQSCAVEGYAVEWGGGSSLEGLPGETVTHTFQLNNMGASDSYTLGISGNSWPTHLVGAGSVTLEPGGSQAVEVTVEVPQFAAVIGSDSFTLTATSEGDPLVKAEVQGLTEATAEAGVSLVSTPETGSGAPGGSAVYEVEVTNTGSYTDTFSLSATGVWTATLGASSTGELGAGESTVVLLEVEVPAGALIGDSDQTTVMAVSGLDGNVSANLLIETLAAYQQIFLPMISNE